MTPDTPLAPATPPSITDTLQQAIALQRAQRLDEAEQLYRAVLGAEPHQPDALHNLGILLAKQRGQLAAALPLLKAALEAHPAGGQFWLSYAEARLDNGQPDEARLLLQQGAGLGLQGDAVAALRARVETAWAKQPDLATLRALGNAGQFTELEQQARAQVARFGPTPALARQLGEALLRLERDAEALPLLEQACAAAPDDENAWNMRALGLSRLGRFDEAHAAYLAALALHPDDENILTNIGANFNRARRYAEALDWLGRALQLHPKVIGLQVNLALALIGLGQEAKACQLIEASMAEGHRVPQLQLLLANFLTLQGKPEQAIGLLEDVLQHAPNHPEALNALGKALGKAERPDEAMAAFTQARLARPTYAAPLVSMADAMIDKGDFPAAQSLLDQALALEPEMPEAWALVAHARKMTAADSNWLETAEAILAGGLGARAEATLCHSIGKFCDDTKQFERGFPFYRRANERKKQFVPPYDRSRMEEMVSHLLRIYSADAVQLVQPGASSSERPLFIVGMPRSGTSLTEQIIASHPDTFGAGELRFWPKKTHELSDAGQTGQFDASVLADAAADCLRNLERYSGDAKRVVDKMPGNFKYLGLIHAAFPNARILHTMRNPVDTCLSIYFQNFNAGHTYANDLDDLAHYYRQYHRLMAHWRQVLPADVFMELPYEQLVEDQEGWSRKIIEFIGLDWDERCLEFYKTERKVGTASNWQARQPIYKSSKERWRNYEQFAAPLLPLLELYDATKGQL